jgi:hypothetical protein
MNLREKTLSVAERYVGTREHGANRGEQVEKFQAAAEISPGEPWCAAFVNFCAERAAEALNVISPLESVPLQGYVPSYVSILPFVTPSEVKPGDLFVVYHADKKRYAHVGFVRSIDLTRNTIRTVEGNSNGGGSRDGDGVYSITRVISPRIRFLRWTRTVKPRP